jgi:hypothetical protein
MPGIEAVVHFAAIPSPMHATPRMVGYLPDFMWRKLF